MTIKKIFLLSMYTFMVTMNLSGKAHYIARCYSYENPVLVLEKNKNKGHQKITLEKPILHSQSSAPCVSLFFSDCKVDESNSIIFVHVTVVKSDEVKRHILEEMLVGWDINTGKKLFQGQLNYRNNMEFSAPDLYLQYVKISSNGKNIFATYKYSLQIILMGWNKDTGKEIFYQNEHSLLPYSPYEAINFTKNDNVLFYDSYKKIHKILDINTNQYRTDFTAKLIMKSKNAGISIKRVKDDACRGIAEVLLVPYMYIVGGRFPPIG